MTQVDVRFWHIGAKNACIGLGIVAGAGDDGLVGILEAVGEVIELGDQFRECIQIHGSQGNISFHLLGQGRST